MLFPTMCCNINLVKPFGNYAQLNTRSTAKNLNELRTGRKHVAQLFTGTEMTDAIVFQSRCGLGDM